MQRSGGLLMITNSVKACARTFRKTSAAVKQEA
jgi:hypothetical protein